VDIHVAVIMPLYPTASSCVFACISDLRYVVCTEKLQLLVEYVAVEYLSIRSGDTGSSRLHRIFSHIHHCLHPTVALLAFISDFEDLDHRILQQTDIVVDQHSLVHSAALAHQTYQREVTVIR
jgi:hypothetical protein